MNDKDQPGNGQDQAGTLARSESDALLEQLWIYDDFAAAEEGATDYATGLVGLGFITAAIRRSAWLWCTMAIAGLLIGLGLRAMTPPAYQASTLVLISHGPTEDPNLAILDDQAIVQSRSVAGLALRKLGLRESVGSFLATYTATVITTRVLEISVNAPSSSEAVSRANALAAAFLRFRAGQLETAQALMLRSLDQEVSQTRGQITSITNQIRQLPPNPTSAAQRAMLNSLRSKQAQATTNLTAIQNAIAYSQSTSKAQTTSAIAGSRQLDSATPLPHSRLKSELTYPAVGLLLGLFLGLGIVVIRAIVSDRLRRRDDVARALGAPVKLSVGAVRLRWWLPGRRGLAAARRADIQRIVTHLDGAVSASSEGTAALAVIPVDKPQVAALSLVSLAMSWAQQGSRVVLADLCRGAPAARLLGVKDSGVHPVYVQETDLVVAVPGRDDMAPVGPRRRRSRHYRASHGPMAQDEPSPFTEAVTAAYASADLLLTLTALDPLLGSDHLPTWTSAVVVTVTAGQSTATRIHAVGEMVRLAGTSLTSAVLIGADKTDESLGIYGMNRGLQAAGRLTSQ